MSLINDRFFREAKLMLESIPSVASESCFALKGGTAINFFVRNMPRLSVDIDLTYLPVEDRATSLTHISEALERIAGKIRKKRPQIQVGPVLLPKTKYVTKLNVTEKDIQIKIEPNIVLRGAVFPTRERNVVSKVEETFNLSASILTVSDSDLYGGKLCAALDRQHPRDLYDVKILFDNEGITPEIRQGFIVYLAGHDETMSKLLDPKLKDITEIFKSEFSGMTFEKIELQELLDTQARLVKELPASLTENDRKFLLSIKEGVPQWELLNLKGVNKLPAIQWKLMNIARMKPDHHKNSVARLRKILEL